MSTRIARSVLCIVIALAVTLSLSMSAVFMGRSHDARALAEAQLKRHAELTMQLSTHGHVHDDGMEDERSFGHLHGHNGSDHTHETPSAAALAIVDYASKGTDWSMNDRVPHIPRPQFRLDRPPRISVIA
jgi:hypothetical protein